MTIIMIVPQLLGLIIKASKKFNSCPKAKSFLCFPKSFLFHGRISRYIKYLTRRLLIVILRVVNGPGFITAVDLYHI